LKFLREVWVWWAWAGTNEVELTEVRKSGGRKRKKGGGMKNKMEPAHGWQAIASRLPVGADQGAGGCSPVCLRSQFFQSFLFLFYFYFYFYF
jgi:hypothetical protein